MEYKRIREFPLYEVNMNGDIRNIKTGRLIKYSIDRDGYCICGLRKDKMKSNRKVHRIVAEIFLINNENLPIVDHINRVRNDNRMENLRWVSHKDNSNNVGKYQLYFNNEINMWIAMVNNTCIGKYVSIDDAYITLKNASKKVL